MDPSKLGQQTPGQQMNLTSFNFLSPSGTSTPAPAATTAPPGGGFTFGNLGAAKTTAMAPPASTGLNFSSPTTKTTEMPTFGVASPLATTAVAQQAPAAFPSINFGVSAAQQVTTSAPPSFNFNPPTAPTAVPVTSLATSITAAPSGFTTPQLGQATGFKLPMQAISAAGPAIGGFGLGTIGAKIPNSGPTSMPTGAPTSTVPSLSLTPAATESVATSLKLPSATTTSTNAVSATTSTAAATSSTAVVPGLGLATSTAPATTTGAPEAQQPGAPTTTMTFAQLEDMINKWTVELGEQERQFLNQATQINAWDNLLNANCIKLTTLHNTVEEVKAQQKKINCDLDFILTQQNELDACLTPLEKEYTSSIYTNDIQREKIYFMAENIDSQLKRMSEDLKETIEHINETSRSQETVDPVLQIGRILNAHMNSLQWIDEQSSKLQVEFESLNKTHENFKREIDRQYTSYY